MTYRASLDDNPVWWPIFCDFVQVASMTEIQRILKQFNAKYVYELPTGKSYIEFEDERYYSMFVMRFSHD